MTTNTLFGHLARRFASSPENLATESLLFILQRSLPAKQAFFHYLEQAGCTLSEGLRLASQYTDPDDQSTPDLVGLDAANHPAFICESKFWAGLTENQPVSYLKQLEKVSGSILIIIGPSKRSSLLWPELLRRVKSAGYEVDQKKPPVAEMEAAVVNGRYALAFASWRSVLNALLHAVESEGDQNTLNDLTQLQGLCDQMDSDVFLPIQSEELTSNIGQRIIHYCDLVDDAAAKLGGDQIVVLEGLRASGSRGFYGRYVYIQPKPYGCFLQFNARFWSKYYPTPIWLSIQDGRESPWSYSAEARDRLASLELAQPPMLFQERELILVPIHLPYGVEKAQVIESIYQQVKTISNLLSTGMDISVTVPI